MMMLDSKEKRIMRNRASAERSRKSKDALIDNLRHSLETHEVAIRNVQNSIDLHPLNHLLCSMRKSEGFPAHVTAFPVNEPAVFNLKGFAPTSS